MFTEKDALSLLDARPDSLELALTGRYMPQSLLDRADLVTEMKEIRHYYATQGLLARDGIER